MIKNRLIRKYTVILALAVTAVWIMPEALLAQGAVVAYVNPRGINDPNYPSDDQLFRLTHIMVVDRYVSPDGTLHTDTLPDRWEKNLQKKSFSFYHILIFYCTFSAF